MLPYDHEDFDSHKNAPTTRTTACAGGVEDERTALMQLPQQAAVAADQPTIIFLLITIKLAHKSPASTLVQVAHTYLNWYYRIH